MSVKKSVEVLLLHEEDEFSADSCATSPDASRHAASEVGTLSGSLSGAVVVRLQGFDLQDHPLLSGVPGLPGEIVAARSTVPLARAQIGSRVVVVFEGGYRRKPILIGTLPDKPAVIEGPGVRSPVASAQPEAERLVLSAEREIVLRCGDATISLTRAGKVIIKGKYIISRSTGYNRIKGAAVDIN
jgi:hypothetical protein